MPKAAADPYSGYTLIDDAPAPRAELVDRPDIANVQPNIKQHDPATFAGLTADHALRTVNAQNIPIDAGQYFQMYDKALQDANQYHARTAETEQAKALEEKYKYEEALPGGLEERKAQIAAQSELIKKQMEQGPSAVAAAVQAGAVPGQQNGKTPGLISAPSPQQQKDWAAYTEGFHNLQDLHTLFDNMATKTFGAGGPAQSLAGLTTKITNLTSPEARVYHSYVDSSLIPLAKSIMGDAATTAGKETVQSAMQEALPNTADTLGTGGQKMFMFYKRALDKLQTERDMARRNGIDTSSIDTNLNDFHSFFNSPNVQKYNPLGTQPVVQYGNSQQAQATTSSVNQGANAGTNPPANAAPGTANTGAMTPSPATMSRAPTYPQISNDTSIVAPQDAYAVSALINAPQNIKQGVQAAAPTVGTAGSNMWTDILKGLMGR